MPLTSRQYPVLYNQIVRDVTCAVYFMTVLCNAGRHGCAPLSVSRPQLPRQQIAAVPFMVRPLCCMTHQAYCVV